MAVRGGNFHVFEDEQAFDVPSEMLGCRWGCGRPVRFGLDRMLRRHETCCRACQDSRGAHHDPDCVTSGNDAQPRSTLEVHAQPRTDPGLDHVMSRLRAVMSSCPSSPADLDAMSAKSLLDGLCDANLIPRLDEKRFLLIFSRFTIGNVIPSVSTRKFFYFALSRISKILETRMNGSYLIARYFFVFRSSKVHRYYRFRSVIGQGSFGVVHRVVHIPSGQERVCKTIFKGSSSVPSNQFENEIRIIAQLDHPHVIRIFEYFEDDREVHLIMELCRHGDLMSRIKNSIKSGSSMPHAHVKTILRQLLRAISFMSSNRVIHKDLKPENIMLVDSLTSSAPVVKVIDFGLSEVFARDQHTSCTVAGTAFYMAPEIFRPPFNFKCDVWSCGVIAFFLTTGYLPFFGATVSEVKSNVLYRKLQWPATFAGSDRPLDIPRDARDLIEKLLEKDADSRPSAVDALEHDFFRDNDWKEARAKLSPDVALNLIAFSKLSLLKRIVINLVAHIWQFEELGEILDLFEELDVHNEGQVSLETLSRALEQLGFSSTDAWKAALSLDLVGANRLTFTSLTAGFVLPLLDRNKNIVRCAFNAFKPSEKGLISLSDMWQVINGHRCVINSDSIGKVPEFQTFREMVLTELDIKSERVSCGNLTDYRPEVQISFKQFRNWMLDLTRNNN